MAQHHDTARAIRFRVDSMARQTSANIRGVVDSVNADGTAIVTLPLNGKVKIPRSGLFDFSPGQSVVIIRHGNNWEAASPSAYGGGLGAPFATP